MKWSKFWGTIVFCVCLSLIPHRAVALNERQMSTATFLQFNLGEKTYQVDGQPFLLDVYPGVENGRILVPIRALAEWLGYSVNWEQSAGRAVISDGLKTVVLYPESTSADLMELSTSYEIQLDVAPKMVDGRILVPIRFVTESLGCRVYWNDEDRTVLVASVGPGGREIGADIMMNYLEEAGKADVGALIAIVDSGVDSSHPYLQNRIVQAHNIVDNSDNVYDESGHGTKVAGIIAACTPETAKIMPIKVDNVNGVYTPESIAAAIDYAVEHRAGVINISLNAAAGRNNHVVIDAVTEAVRQGVTVVAAAGNNGNDVLNYTPSNAENAIIVTAVNGNRELWSSSNYGDTVVVAAPGVGVVSTIPNGDYGSSDGTSMAAPYVSAAAAMIRMDIPGITPDEIRNLLLGYSTDLGAPGWDPWYGGGLIDLAQYITYRETGSIGDLTRSIEERTRELDKEIEAFRQEKLDEHLAMYGLFWSPLFAADLDTEAQRLYGIKDYFAAGYYFEKAISYHNSDNIAKNNLAYMIRRGEYTSNQYPIRQLLDQAMAAGNAHAFVNDALLFASKNQWEEADSIFRGLCKQFSGTFNMEQAIQTWRTLSYQNDAEGDLVLGWLMRYGISIESQYSQQKYMERALAKYPTLPEWMKLPAQT